ncbi:related to muscle-derived protein [Cephalotrichum gorgonifer]|uniref:Related to muscle-derived protein n=1 Tax=Cephalotrichum gorgonifer TaxID=2041049 RepID=A0AAE8MSL6_9PEZI|nr:related to muscle-derived protein [Cephalotrichum gorgonifer]
MPSNVNGHSEGSTPNGSEVAPPPPPPCKKGKQRKLADSGDTSRLLQARISQLEQDAAGEKDQEAEIEREVKRANRDLVQQMAKMGDPTDKIDFLLRKSSELLADMRRMERENQKNKKRGDALQKEKDTNRTELGKTTTLKEKLEKLCRELQRDNNKLKNENKTLSDTLKHSDAAWDEKLATVLAKLDGYQDAKDNPGRVSVDTSLDELFRVRFKSFIEQYDLRELHYHATMRTKELEVQYNISRYEREKKRADVETKKCRNFESQIQTFTKTEADLRSQLNVYVDKFKQVEDTLNNSNDLFLSFRKEMEDMSKKTKRLEKENETFKRKHDATNANIFRMAEEREELKRRQDGAEKKAEKLMAIIRNMQQQGRKVPASAAGVVEGYEDGGSGHVVEEEEEEEEEDEEEDEDEEDDDRDNNEGSEYSGDEEEREVAGGGAGPAREQRAEGGASASAARRVFGPERPARVETNGH